MCYSCLIMNNHPSPIEKAGAIILNKDRTKIVLLYRGSHNDWSFPKGHIEPGEHKSAAMLREIKEETGMVGKIISSLPGMEYLNANGELVHLQMYLLQVESEQLVKEYEEDKLEWIDLNMVAEKLTHQNLKNYFLKQLPGLHEIRGKYLCKRKD